MKSTFLTTLFVLALSLSALGQRTFCLNLVPIENSETALVVSLQVQGDQAFKLGTSNLQFSFDDNVLSSPVLELDGLPGPPFYQVSTVTTPRPNECSFNIELGFPGFGTEMSGPDGWTEVGQIRFTSNGGEFTQPLSWSYNGGTTETVMFLDDESTQIFATDESCLVGTEASVLPVFYLGFDASKSGKSAKLSWETANEYNNAGFYVQHSADGVDFSTLGFVEGNNVGSQYEFFHESPLLGVNYYRLQQEDFDGTRAFTDVRIVSFDGLSSQLKVFPNPASSTVNFSGIDFSRTVEVKIFTATGKRVVSTKTNSPSLDVSSLPSGIYYVNVVEGTTEHWSKITVSR